MNVKVHFIETTVTNHHDGAIDGSRQGIVLQLVILALQGKLGILHRFLGGFDFIVNTVPARVISDGALCAAAEDALLLELASAPGGFDRTLSANIGLRALAAPGLPGKYAPQRAAELMREAVYQSLKEGET